MAVNGFSEQQIADFKESFNIIASKDATDHLSVEQLGLLLESFGLPANRDAVRSIIVYITENSDIDPIASFPDFLRILALTGGERGMPRSESEAVKEAFEVYDEYGTGYVPVTVFRSILESLGEEVLPEEIEHLVEMADTNQDGHIDYGAFIDQFLQEPEA